MACALITGITGQDGSYLTEFLLEKGYVVHGITRSMESVGASRLRAYCEHAHTQGRLFLWEETLRDPTSMRRILFEVAPDEIYHLAGQSHVGLSFDTVESTCEVTAMATLRLLQTALGLPKPPRVFHASSSEIFGQPEEMPQDERTPFRPRTPYGCAKAFSTQLVGVYRQSLGMYACNGILFNHESPRRGENFVTQKICRAAAAIKQGRQQELLLGSLSSQRDWGDARDFIKGMWLMLQQPEPDDYVLATGQFHSVQDILEVAFGTVGLDWRKYVKPDPQFIRPSDPAHLLGNPNKARQVLGWHPTKSFADLIAEMTFAALG